MIGRQHALAPCARRAAAGKQRAQHAHRGKGNLEISHAAYLERLGHKPYDLRVGASPGNADALHAYLGELAGRRLQVGFGLAEHALGVAESQSARRHWKTGGAHARHLQRHIGAHGKQVALRVIELERRTGHVPARPHHVHHLERRGLYGQIPFVREALLHLAHDALALHSLVGQHVPKPGRRYEIHSSRSFFPLFAQLSTEDGRTATAISLQYFITVE